MITWITRVIAKIVAADENVQIAALMEQATDMKDQVNSIYLDVLKLSGDLHTHACCAILDRNDDLRKICLEKADQVDHILEKLNRLRPRETPHRVLSPAGKDDPAIPRITGCFRDYVLTEDAIRNNRWSWMAFHPPRDTEEGKEYYRLSEDHQKAVSALWMATDIEYDDSDFRDAVWNWRYWKVMARKCCWYQRYGTTFRAGQTMSRLQAAETQLAKVCGLSDIYRTASSYIEEKFPNLKMQD